VDLDDYGERLTRLFEARTREEGAAVLADLPPFPARTSRRRPRRRYAEADRVEGRWVPTAEVFRDPTSNRVMRVWVDPADNSRHYVAEGDGPAQS
jgi:hypothetical protein